MNHAGRAVVFSGLTVAIGLLSMIVLPVPMLRSVGYGHRWAAALLGLGILTALMLPALSLHLGEPGSSAQATSGPAHEALATLTDGGIPSGVLTPAEVLVSG